MGCQVAESESALEHVTSDAIDMQEKTVYLHLKKFFRGSRFTFKAFLKNLAEKYQEGDIVCVSGKVSLLYSPFSPTQFSYCIASSDVWRDCYFLKLIHDIINEY